ncbi:MAG TPA: efflux RND transporter periplasmic adaptor subunit [Candidatus Saccharimonadales bacterium]|nr:efflux RND transporter periplasmic adaptor subunit [Candidatus Saccharimonadales bacterium]
MKNFAKSNRRALTIVAVIALIGVSVWAAFHFTRIPAFSETQIFEVQKGAIKSEISADITLQPATNADLAFENSGKIKNIYVSVGDQVKKGQLLAEEVNSDYVVSLREAEAARRAAQADLEGAQENIDIQGAKLKSLKNANAKKYDVKAQKETKDQAGSSADSKEALLEAANQAVIAANLQLAKTRLTAPMDGVITDKSIEIGEVVSQAGPVMKIASGDNLEADAYVSELDVKKIAVGGSAEIVLSSADGNKITLDSKIKNIYPAETVQNGVSSYKVVFDLAGQESNLKSGMTGMANIKISDQAGAMVVPQSSVFSDAGKKYVMVMSGGFPERKDVQVGAYGSDGTVEVLSGLAEGDKILKF